jgi:hypothetical protein
MDGYYRVRNFEKHQHYKDRTPPWIKLHNALLDDYRFQQLKDSTKAHLMLMWLLASRYDNRIPADPRWIALRIGANEPIDFESLVSSEFLERCDCDSKTLAECKHFADVERETEGEAETEGEREKSERSPKGEQDTEEAGFVAFWKEWPTHSRKVARAKCSRLWRRNALEKIADVILDAVKRSRRSSDWTEKDGQFIPAPHRWLNESRWETANFLRRGSSNGRAVRKDS